MIGKKIGSVLIDLLPHITVAMAAMFITFWILDYFNPLMNFLNGNISNKLLLVFCILAIVSSLAGVKKEHKKTE